MSSPDYERFRQELDQQLDADIELLKAGYRAKLRAFEMLHYLQGDFTPGPLAAAESLRSLQPAALAPSPAAAAPSPAPPPPPPPRSKAYELYDAILAVLPTLPEVFSPSDVSKALASAPRRASLYRVLAELEQVGGWIERQRSSDGARHVVYRRLPQDTELPPPTF